MNAFRWLRSWFRFWFAGRDAMPGDIDGSTVLRKALVDSWDYCIVLRSGLTVRCGLIESRHGWLLLREVRTVERPNGQPVLNGEFDFGRGIEVRLAEVVLVADFES